MLLVFLLKVSVICALIVSIVCCSCSLVIDLFILMFRVLHYKRYAVGQHLCKTFLWGPNFLPLNFCWLALDCFFFYKYRNTVITLILRKSSEISGSSS